MNKQDKVQNTWNNFSDEHFDKVDFDIVFREIDRNPYMGFPKTMGDLIREYFPELRDKKVCVPSCGDCVAAFAFCALGAEVFAADISSAQIENAKRRAHGRNLNIQFFCSDSMCLKEFRDDYFDLIYTSNGVHVWIWDLQAMYKTFNRILKRGGTYIMFDTHPCSRPFDKERLESGEFVIRKPYEETGPFPGDITYDWRIQDYINALVRSDFSILQMEEFHSVPEDLSNHNYLSERNDRKSGNYDWHKNPCAALPQCLGLVCRKTLV